MAGRYRRPTTPEQRAKAAAARDQKLAALHETLAAQVSALATGPEWRRWLDVAAKFHNYSFGNTLLIWAQKPEATQVAGYGLWQQLGRQVTKGERGIQILAPVMKKPEQPDDDTTDTTDSTENTNRSAAAGPDVEAADSRQPRRVVGYRPAYVWDLSQTSGEPLPTPPRPQLLAGQAPAGLWDALATQATAAGFSVQRRDIAGDAGPNGWTDFAAREVVVRADVDDAQAVKTLAHELGHVLMHDPASFPDRQTSACRGTGEVEAESLAYLVAAEHGLDTSAYSFAYVAGWAARTGDVDAALRETGARVLGTAHGVLTTAAAHLAGDQAAAQTAAAQVAARAATGATRTDALREQATAGPALPAGVDRDRLLAANDTAVAFYIEHLTVGTSPWAADYLTDRLGTSYQIDHSRGVGYAPASWTALTDHLHADGFTDAEIVGAGLGVRARTGHVVDRFRDRVMLPIDQRTDAGDVEVVGFVGRRNPAEDATTDSRNPKYLNTSNTALYSKGEQLFGLGRGAGQLDNGAVAVVVEGPFDALAIERACGTAAVGVAPLGTAFTGSHARQLAAAVTSPQHVVVAADHDPAGHRSAHRTYTALTAERLDPRGAVLPDGLDPADTLRQHGVRTLADAVAGAQPMGRQLVDAALAGHELTWVEQRIDAARIAAGIIMQTAPNTWEREIVAVAERTPIEEVALRQAVVDHIETDSDAWGRLTGHDRRDDLDRGQHVTASAAQIAAQGGHNSGRVRASGPASEVVSTARPAAGRAVRRV